MMLKNIVCGCRLSGLVGEVNDMKFTPMMTGSMPSRFDTDAPADVVNQGREGSCVSQCLYEMVRYDRETLDHEHCPIDRVWVYDRRQNKGVQGMAPREGLDILQRGRIISLYAQIPSMMAARSALVACGPILIALPVYNTSDRFWLGDGRREGYHAVTVTAYDEGGFTFKNTWGASWGVNGYGYISVNDFNHKVAESWVILK